MRAETIRLGGNRQSVIYRGGDGPPLVWLHSLYGVEADAPVIDRLSERYAVVAPLAPGFADLDELERFRDIHDLVVHGAEDRFVPPAYADDFVALLPNASREIIPAAGHMLTVEALDQTLAVVDRFLRGPWDAAGAARDSDVARKLVAEAQ